MNIDCSSLKTPCIVYDGTELDHNISAFKDAFQSAWSPANVIIGYSVKTSPVADLIGFSAELGCYAEVVSDDEYRLALCAGIERDHIILNGPVKTKRTFFEALRGGSIVNIDSIREIKWSTEYVKEYDLTPKVGLRINFDLESACPGSTMAGDEGCRFGYCIENGEFEAALCELRECGIEPTGLHAHFSSATRAPEVYKAIAEKLCETIERYNLNALEYIDMGGGYYGGGANCAAYYEYADAISTALIGTVDPSSTKLILEPGGSILATAASYFGKVLDVKNVRGCIFAVSELSKLYLNSTVFSRRAFKYERIGSKTEKIVPKQVICGYTCMEMDRICDLIDEPLLEEGEIIAIRNAGAYTVSFGPSFFISKPPSLYLLCRDGQIAEMRWASECLG